MSEYTSPSSELEVRQQVVRDKLSALVGMSHPRISVASLRRSTGDEWAAVLTYDEITTIEPKDGVDLSLLTSAKRCTDPEVECTLQEGHLHHIDNEFSDGTMKGIPSKLGRRTVQDLDKIRKYFGLSSNETIHPHAEGYDWYRMLVVATNEEQAVLIMMPWMQPWAKGGSPMPIIYTLGNPAIEDVKEITQAYADYVSEFIPQEMAIAETDLW